MKTSLETLEGLKRSLTVELPIEDFNQKTDKILKGMSSEAKIDGFRKGKVPLQMLRKTFGARASADAANELVGETIGAALEEVKAAPAAQPNLTKVDSKGDKTFFYTVEFEVFPEIEVDDFDKLTVEMTEVKITKADEDRTLTGLKEQLTEYKSVKRKSKAGDKLTIDFKGMIDGEVFEGGEAKDFQMVIGKGSMIEGFEEGLTDIAAGKDTTLELKFPEKYHMQNLADKDVTFEVSVKVVESPKEPKEDSKFAEKFGEKDMDALRLSMKEQMRVEIDGRLDKINKDSLFAALLDANDFEVPESVVASEAQSLLQEMNSRMQQQGMPENPDMPASLFNDEATRRVKLGLLVSKIASDNKFVASKEQIDEKLKEVSLSYGENAQQMIDYYNEDPSRLTGIELLVVEKMVQDLILDKAKTTLVNKKFEEVATQQQ